jgi:HEAT repeat protein
MRLWKTLTAFMVVILMSGTANAGWGDFMLVSTSGADERSEREADLYEEGMDAIDDEDWDDAVKYFGKVAEMKGSRADGALYWMAYALHKSNSVAEARKVVDALRKAYPKSQWLNDANALEMEMTHERGGKIRPEDVDSDELKVIAINSLMHTDPEKAYPLLKKILDGNSSRKVKGAAMFVLSQSSSQQAQKLLADYAKGNAGNPSLRKQAVQYLGVAGGERNRALLSEIYNSATSREVKKEVLQAFMVSGDKTRILNAAKTEKDPELKEQAIQLLGVMGARADLHTMYDTEKSRELREEIITALFVAGDHQRISQIATSEKDGELREEAIQKLGLMGKKTAPLLLQLYATETDPEIKEAVLDGLFVQGNARALIDLSKKEKNRELKKEILQKLSVMGNKEAIDYMLEILNEE